jgi:hypothetical protein
MSYWNVRRSTEKSIQGLSHRPDTDFARLAAYVDGEGSLTISPFRTKSSRTGTSMHVGMQVCNTDPALPQWCLDTFGGSVNVTAKYDNKSDHRRKLKLYRWDAGTTLVEHLLRRCLPFFVIKRRQAEIVLEFRETYQLGYCGKRVLPQFVLDKREDLRRALQLEKWKFRPDLDDLIRAGALTRLEGYPGVDELKVDNDSVYVINSPTKNFKVALQEKGYAS